VDGKPNYIQSKNLAYYLVVQPDGNVVLYAGTHHIGQNHLWATNTHHKGKGPYKLRLLDSGNLVLFDGADNTIWHSNTPGKGIKSVRLQDNGDLVLLDENNMVFWQTNTARDRVSGNQHEVTVDALKKAPYEFSYGNWNEGSYLRSPNAAYYGYFYNTGEFELYMSNHLHPKNRLFENKLDDSALKKFESMFGKKTVPVQPLVLTLQEDGNLVTYDAAKKPHWSTHTSKEGAKPHRLTLQDDGNLVLYDGNSRALWSTKTSRN